MTAVQVETPGWVPPTLHGRVALVTGASRGVGRGIARALGEAGATVYVTGRSTGPESATEGLVGDIHETAAEVDRRGGRGVAVPCDHMDESQTAALFDRLTAQAGRLDILVNNVWSGYERWGEQRFDAKFWEQPLWRYDLCFGSLRAHYQCSQLAAPLLMAADRGLLVEIGYTDGPTYLGQLAYDVAKHACDRLAYDLAQELARTDVVAVALHPGFVRTERVEDAAAAITGGPAAVLHSPEYVGRAVACLAADDDARRYGGRSLRTGDLAEEYGFADIDGRRPPPFRLEGRRSLANRMDRLQRAASPRRRPAVEPASAPAPAPEPVAPGASPQAIQSHYDLSNDFYRLWLDPAMVYSCALWAGADDTLTVAQDRKLDYHVHQAGAAGADRVLDVGCGWGGMLECLVRRHGVGEAVGLTLSPAQADHIAQQAVAGVEARVESWADHPVDQRYQAVISIGAFEHFARPGLSRAARVDGYRAFFARCHSWLPDGGGLSIQTVTKGNNVRISRETLREMAFVMERIFPDSELPWLSEIVEASERRFRLVAMRNDAAHYARTATVWLGRIREQAAAATELIGPERLADYERYLEQFVGQFDQGHVELVRLTFRRA